MTRSCTVLAILILALPVHAEAIRVVTTVPGLADLAKQVGGDAVSTYALVRGPQDPHFVDPRPSFVTKLHRADIYVEMGLELEKGWAPVLLAGARNPAILSPGGRGYVNAGTAIRPLQIPRSAVDRSMGDIHLYGNPHFLIDPLNGLRVAALLRDRLSGVAPDRAERFQAGYAAFEKEFLVRLVGTEAAQAAGPRELIGRVERGDTAGFRGWVGRLAEARGTPVVEDHNAWIYFAHRFGLEIVETLEPKPGIAPTTRHLERVITAVASSGARLILSSPYFDPRHARWIAQRTDAVVVPLAHQIGSREGTEDYLALIDYNVNAVAAALEGAAPGH